jgi:hypothetical protein
MTAASTESAIGKEVCYHSTGLWLLRLMWKVRVVRGKRPCCPYPEAIHNMVNCFKEKRASVNKFCVNIVLKQPGPC